MSVVDVESTKLSNDGPKRNLDVVSAERTKRRVKFKSSVSLRTFESSEIVCPEFESILDGEKYPETTDLVDDQNKLNRRNLQPQPRDGRKHRSNVNDHPWMPTGNPVSQEGTPRQT